jgi:cation:H+ antiporter
MWKILIWLLLGSIALWYGSDLLITGATEIAEKLGVSEAVIGVSMVALGTSIPELAASLIAAIKKEGAISLGNLIGSNIFNIGSVLGITSIIKPIQPGNAALLNHDIFWMLGISAIIAPLALLPSKNRFFRWEGVLLVVLYVLFIYLKFKY